MNAKAERLAAGIVGMAVLTAAVRNADTPNTAEAAKLPDTGHTLFLQNGAPSSHTLVDFRGFGPERSMGVIGSSYTFPDGRVWSRSNLTDGVPPNDPNTAIVTITEDFNGQIKEFQPDTRLIPDAQPGSGRSVFLLGFAGNADPNRNWAALLLGVPYSGGDQFTAYVMIVSESNPQDMGTHTLAKKVWVPFVQATDFLENFGSDETNNAITLSINGVKRQFGMDISGNVTSDWQDPPPPATSTPTRTATPTATPPGNGEICGDVNQNGAIDKGDPKAVQNYLRWLSRRRGQDPLSPTQKRLANVDGDNVITPSDQSLLNQVVNAMRRGQQAPSVNCKDPDPLPTATATATPGATNKKK